MNARQIPDDRRWQLAVVRIALLLAFIFIGAAVVRGVTEALERAAHGMAAAPAEPLNVR